MDTRGQSFQGQWPGLMAQPHCLLTVCLVRAEAGGATEPVSCGDENEVRWFREALAVIVTDVLSSQETVPLVPLLETIGSLKQYSWL